LNALVGQRIARVSATPGKTTMLNVFRVEFEKASLYLIDLPGYGYARASHAERGRFRQLIRHAIDRPLLAGVIWLLDIRREPSRDDTSIHEVFAEAGSPILAALTKGDTLARGRRLDRARILGAALSLPPDQVITTSARTREGIPELRQAVAALALQGQTTV
jgi:GTP-binding protein